jgi:hypothetical protein
MAATNSISSKTKANYYYSKLILDILFMKWFPLSNVFSPRITTPEEHVSSTNQKR